MSNRNRISNIKLQSLLQITQLINSNAPTKTLLNFFSKTLQDLLNIEKILIYHYTNNWNIVLRKGISLEDAKKIDFEKKIKPVKEITHLTYLNKTKKGLEHFDFIIPVFHNDKPLAYVLIGDFDEEMTGVSPSIKHLQFIQTIANIMTVAIENKILFRQKIARERLKKELEVAKQVQQYLIPDNEKFQQFEDIITLEGYYRPHYEIGGDYYDIIKINNNELIMCIGDVSGKGVPAAILMANFQANFRALLNFSRITSLKTIIRKLNKLVIDLTHGDMFITFFLVKYNKKENEFSYINAGHNHPLFYNSKTQNVLCLSDGTSGLGMTNECMSIKEGRIKNIAPNSKLILYTDGLVETIEDKDVVFDLEILKSILKKGNSLKNDMFHLKYMVETEKNYFDDISILGAEFK